MVLSSSKLVAEPTQRKSRALCDPHHMPAPRNRVTKGVYAAVWFEHGFTGGREHYPGCANRRAHRAWMHNSHSYCAPRLISRAGHDGDTFTQSGPLRAFRRDIARDFLRFENLGKQRFIK